MIPEPLRLLWLLLDESAQDEPLTPPDGPAAAAEALGGAPALGEALSSLFADEDDDLPDFLGVVGAAAAPSRPPQGLSRSPEAAPLRARSAQAVAEASEVPLGELLRAIEARGGLDQLNGEAAWAVCASLARAQGQGRAAGHGAVSQLVQRCIASPDVSLMTAGLQVATKLALTEVQGVVATQLRDRADKLGFGGVNALLDCLAVLGDGRCVRVMEEALLGQRAAFTEHQAWRARHIVQLIRREHRR